MIWLEKKSDYRLGDWRFERDLLPEEPTFLVSFMRGSRVRKPFFLRMGRKRSGLTWTRARLKP